MAKLKLENVNKIYPNGFQAVYDFNLEIEEGEFIVLVGPSGCGKSTTLRMIAGLEDITSGNFLLDSKLANTLSSRDRGVAMVFQSYALYPHLSVFDNLAFGLDLRGYDEDYIEERSCTRRESQGSRITLTGNRGTLRRAEAAVAVGGPSSEKPTSF